MVQARLALIFGASLWYVGCGGGTRASVGNGYEEYVCPDPIGKIVREDCSRSALQYQGADFRGSVGAAGIGASASYKENAIREADSLVAMLKEQRVQLCNDFNTCKMTTAEYREEQRGLDESFVALLALKDKMAAMDAEGAAKLLKEISEIRLRTASRGAAAPQAPSAKPVPPKSPSGAGGGLALNPRTVYVLRSKSNGTCLEAASDDSGPSAPARDKPCAPVPDQKWTTSLYSDNAYALRLESKPPGDAGSPAPIRCLDLPHSSGNDGVALQTYKCTGFPNQRWKVVLGDDGTMRVSCVATGHCLTVAEKKGDPVELRSCDGGQRQAWLIDVAQ
jgi:hypothetical protein